MCRAVGGDNAEKPWAASLEMTAKVEEFRKSLYAPDDIWIRGPKARKKYGLSREDLKLLRGLSICKENPYEHNEQPFTQYPLKSVVELACKKHGEEALVQHYYNRYLLRNLMDVEAKRSIYDGSYSEDVYALLEEEREHDPTGGGHGAVPGDAPVAAKRYWYNAPSSATIEGRQSIVQGLKTNSSICLIKGVVWFSTGSHAMFADWMHSIADVANYSYRLMELSRSSRQGDRLHPYGYAPLRYITADRSFVFLGFVGGLWPLGLGLMELMEAAPAALGVDAVLAPAAVFLASAVFEGAAVRAAYREILSQAGAEKVGAGKRDSDRVLQYLREGRDVMSTATFAEASSGMLGAGVGLMGLCASWFLQTGTPDIVASVLMASMVTGLSAFLLRRSCSALLGSTLPGWRVKALILRLESHPSVVAVYDVKTVVVGTDTVRFKAEVQFNPQAITERLLQNHRSREAKEVAWEPHAVLKRRLHQIKPRLLLGCVHPARARLDVRAAETEVAAWLFSNNSIFYEALAWETKDVERLLREDLQDFRSVHIDLEPW